jgi:hypothetical protein
MKRLLLVLVLAGAVVPVSSSAQQARQVNEPGMPTTARTHILNRGADEAVPVVLTNGGEVQRVTVVGTPTVSLAADTVMPTRQIRQVWEYRRLSVPGGGDPTAALNAAGTEGWEAVGTTQAGAAGALQILLKRPR